MSDLEVTSPLLSDVPNDFLCPITLDIMTDPVCTCDGHPMNGLLLKNIFVSQIYHQKQVYP